MDTSTSTAIQWRFETTLSDEQKADWERICHTNDSSSASSFYTFVEHSSLLTGNSQSIYALAFQGNQLIAALPLLLSRKKFANFSFNLLHLLSHDHLDHYIAPGQIQFNDPMLISTLLSQASHQVPGWHMFIARRWCLYTRLDKKFKSPVYTRKSAYFSLVGHQSIDSLISKKLLKNVQRQERKLETDNIELRLAEFTDETSVAEALDRFIKLESSGWKGTAGSAIGCIPKVKQFYLNTWCQFAAVNKARIFLLFNQSDVIAGCIAFQHASHLYLHKITYDESLSQYGPGTILVKKIIQKKIADKTTRQVCFNTSPEWIHRWHPEFHHLVALQGFNSNIKGRLLAGFFWVMNHLKLLKRKISH